MSVLSIFNLRSNKAEIENKQMENLNSRLDLLELLLEETERMAQKFALVKSIPETKTTRVLFGGKRVVIFGLTGTKRIRVEKFKELGIDQVWCTSVKTMCGDGSVNMLPDENGDFAKGMGMLVKKDLRSYAVVANDLRIEKWFVAPFSPTDDESVLEYLRK